MDTKVLFVLFTVICLWCCDARDLTVLQTYNRVWHGEVDQQGENVVRDGRVCELCELYAGEALTYLSQNKTQTEIINALHESCSRLPSFRQQCTVLVDYYAPIFFTEVTSMNAGDFCRRVDLCRSDTSIALRQSSTDKCEMCHNVLTEALLKLKDPDTELEVLQMILKACNSIGKSAQKCKRLVFEYTPIILVNAEQFLEANDICTILHACGTEKDQVSFETETSMVSAS